MTMRRDAHEKTLMPTTHSSSRCEATASGRWHVADGSLESLKWLALALMVGDHVNKYLLSGQVTTLYLLGRMAMPLFGFVLMYNLARPRVEAASVHRRVVKRLAAFGVLATPAFVLLVGWWPLNIMATLLVATFIAWLLELRTVGHRSLALVTFVVGGTVVEFWWPGLLCCLGARSFIRRPSIKTAIAWLLATASLWFVNGNFAAMAALPLILGFSRIHVPLERQRWVFYAFYPAHLFVLALALHLASTPRCARACSQVATNLIRAPEVQPLAGAAEPVQPRPIEGVSAAGGGDSSTTVTKWPP
eukprot:TRINITY_DN41655_c0_g1_i1.p1 TRINITY_DN41655_c0_g1~~TRINITY_DN41655_c0_g1_i1.p1  ORF type:complete len:304 (+),score=43.75 TRINITY_DN41655_c0_g1_i1:99-1010(+)